MNQPSTFDGNCDSRNKSRLSQAFQDAASVPLPPPLLREAEQDFTLSTILRYQEEDSFSRTSQDDNDDDEDDHHPTVMPVLTANVSPAAPVILAHLVEDDEAARPAEIRTTCSTAETSSSLTFPGGDEDEEAGIAASASSPVLGVVVVVDAKPWNEFAIPRSTRRIFWILIVGTIFLTLGILLLEVCGRGGLIRTRTTKRSANNNNNDNDDVVGGVATPKEQQQQHTDDGTDHFDNTPHYTSEQSPSTTALPTPSPVQSDSVRMAEFRDHFLSILPVFSQEVIRTNASSPQRFSFDYTVQVVTNFPEIPPDDTLVDLYAIKVFHTVSNGNQWYGYCSIQTMKTIRFDLCLIPITTCDEATQTFHSLKFSGLGVEGLIPPEFGLMSNLEIIELSDNAVQGTLPVELGSLVKLRHLNLDSNQLQGTIPTTLLSPSHSLNTVHLGNNTLEGTLAPEWAHLHASLEVLHLHANDLRGTLPESWSQLTHLRELTLHHNPRLSGTIPPELCARVRTGQVNLTLDCGAPAAGNFSCGPSCPCHCVKMEEHNNNNKMR